MKKQLLLLVFLTLLTGIYTQAQFTLATDNAGNYSGTWGTGSNYGTGFNAWSISYGANTGTFIGNPANNGMGTTGIGTTAFGLYATGNEYCNANRTFDALQWNDKLSFYWTMNWDANTIGNKGFDIKAGGSGVFNVNNAGNQNITCTNGTIDNGYGTNPMFVEITRTGESSYEFKMTKRSDGTTYTTTFTSSNPVNEIGIYIGNQNSGSGERNIYFNYFTITNSGEFNIPSSSVTYSKDLAGNGSLTKSGSSILVLTGTNTYTGTTNITNGTLRLTGSITSSSVTVASGAILKSDGNNSTINALTVNSGGQFTVEPIKALTVSGNFSNSGTTTLKSDATGTGSLIVNGTITGNITSERYIAGYTSASDGWHLISSPVNNFPIANTTLAPGANDDLFWYDETQHLWLNYKENEFSSMTNGYGYLCAYQSTSTKSFTGTPNHSDLTFTNLSRTSNRGFHALGNPFQSALKWNDGNWALTDVNANAYLLNNGGTYSTISANGMIPSNQGFFVRVLSGTNSVTIPKSARLHDNTPWYKSGNSDLRVNLIASSTTDNTYIESGFLANSSATYGFDEVWDGFYLSGINGAPKMYITLNGEKLSLNAMPEFAGSYELAFIKGASDNYRMTFQGFENLLETEAFLTDLKTGDVIIINETQEYLFSSQSTDPEIRFVVSFDLVGLPESNPSVLSVFVKDRILYFLSPVQNGTIEIFNLSGQLLQKFHNSNGPFPLPFSPGIYLVRITTQGQTHTQKIFIQ